MAISKDVFLSYHSPDRESVRTVKSALEAFGLTTFFDRQDLTVGSPWGRELEDALGLVRAVAVFVGPDFGERQRNEVGFALERQADERLEGRRFPVIPVLLPGSKPQNSFLFQNSWIDLRGGLAEQDEIGRLVHAIRGDSAASERRDFGDVCPYRGLSAFREEDEALFFGRQALSKTLLDKLLSGRDVVAVIGASGSGKSSLVHAGLLPLLRRQRPPHSTWDAVSFRPGNRPFHALAAALAPLVDPAMSKLDRTLKTGKLGEQISADPGRLTDIVLQILRDSGGTDRLLIVIDQFEELFTLAPESDRKALPRAILDASRAAPVQFVLTVRADYYGHLINASRELSDRVESNIVNVGPMNLEELRESIVKPAELAGRSFEPGLADRILSDLGDEPGQLPLLQFALSELWSHRRPLTHAAYDELGGVANAISRKAETVLQDFDAGDQARIRQIFSRLVHVTTPAEGGEDVRRRPTLDELGSQARPLIDKLAKERLLVTMADKSAEGGEIVCAEVAHEALIRRWPRLRAWLDEDRGFLLWRQRLRQSMAQWRHTQGDEGALLRGPLLDEASRWQAARPEGLNDDERTFVDTSSDLKSRLLERDQARRSRSVKIVAAAVLVGLAISAVALWQWKNAAAQRENSVAQALLSQARYYRENDLSKLDLAVLFGLESQKHAPSALADALVRESLLMLPRVSSPVDVDCDLTKEVFAFAPGGRYLACVNPRGAIAVLFTANGQSSVPAITRYASLRVSTIALSPAGDFLVVGFTGGGGFKLVKTADASETASGGTGSDATAAAFDAAGKSWAVAVWSEQGSDIFRATGPAAAAAAIPGARQLGRVYALAWGGDALAASHAGATSAHMDVTILANGRTSRISGGATLGTIALAKDGAFAAVCRNNTVVYGGAETAGSEKQLTHTMPARVAALSPEGRYMASGSDDGSAHVMNTRTGVRIAVAPVGSPVEAAVFKDESTLMLLARDGKIRTVDLAARGGIESLRSTTGRIVDISPTGRYFVTWTGADSAPELVINDRLGKRLWSLTAAGEGFLPNSGLGFSQDETSFTVADPQNGVTVYDAAGSVLHHDSAAAPSSIRAISGDGKTVAWAIGSTIKMWRLDGATLGAKPRDLAAPGVGLGEIHALALSPDGALLAAGAMGAVSVFDVKANSWRDPIGMPAPVTQAVFSNDGSALLTLAGRSLMSFRMPEGAPNWPVEAGTEIPEATHVSFSADNQMIALIGEDVANLRLALELIDAESGKRLTSAWYPANDKLDGLRRAIAFDNDVIVIADTISISRIPRTPEALARSACATLSRNLTPEEWKAVEMPPSRTCPELP